MTLFSLVVTFGGGDLPVVPAEADRSSGVEPVVPRYGCGGHDGYGGAACVGSALMVPCGAPWGGGCWRGFATLQSNGDSGPPRLTCGPGSPSWAPEVGCSISCFILWSCTHELQMWLSLVGDATTDSLGLWTGVVRMWVLCGDETIVLDLFTSRYVFSNSVWSSETTDNASYIRKQK